MKLLCFQAKRFRWKTHTKTIAEARDREVEDEVAEVIVVFLHAEAEDAAEERAGSVLRQSLRHVKWLANKRQLSNVVLHSFTHLGGSTAAPQFAESFIAALAERLREGGYRVSTTPFGYLCEWDLSVYGESLAKVWKEIH